MAGRSDPRGSSRETTDRTHSKQNQTEAQKRDLPAYMISHGQGQVRNPQTDRRLKENRDH